MHMADALLTPTVGGIMLTTSTVILWQSSKKLKLEMENPDNYKIPLMGVLGAFIFAAQMINFTIPGTGSSGHLGGGMILAILLCPYSAFITMASVLTIQAMFFGDGGLLSLGCNIFNIGFFPCFIAYPLIYKTIAKDQVSQIRIIIGTVIAAIIGLQLGSFGVVLETYFSGVSELPFDKFLLVMQPIHLIIGIVEGLASVVVILFVWKTRPEIMDTVKKSSSVNKISYKKIIMSFLFASIIIGSVFSWFASSNPDGLEWAIDKTAGKEIKAPEGKLHKFLFDIQRKISFLPDYGFKENSTDKKETESVIDTGTSVSGIIGSVLVVLLTLMLGIVFKWRSSKA